MPIGFYGYDWHFLVLLLTFDLGSIHQLIWILWHWPFSLFPHSRARPINRCNPNHRKTLLEITKCSKIKTKSSQTIRHLLFSVTKRTKCKIIDNLCFILVQTFSLNLEFASVFFCLFNLYSLYRGFLVLKLKHILYI